MANTKHITVDQLSTVAQGITTKSDARFVKQETGKGLSTNDFDAAAKQKLDGITSATMEAAGLTQLSSATDSEDEDKAATPKAVKEAYDLANGKQSPQTTLEGYGITDAYTKQEVDSKITAAASSAYHAGGSKSASAFTDELLIAENEGKVYNLTDDLEVTASNKELFTENTEGTIPAGTNIAVVNVGGSDSASYKFDVMAGFVDLSGYATLEDIETASEEDIQAIVTGLYSD